MHSARAMRAIQVFAALDFGTLLHALGEGAVA